MHLSVKRLALGLVAVFNAALVILAGCLPNSKTTPSHPPAITAQIADASEYVGSAMCGTCHPQEWQSHQKTYHAHTFAPMTVSDLGKNAPPQGKLPGTDSTLAIQDGHYFLVKEATGKALPLDYALGSGKQGMTFIKIRDEEAVFEMRKSYSPRTRKWYTTPGHEDYDDWPGGVGITYRGNAATKCIRCHAVTVPADSLRPEPQFIGVGCESCHGPGRAHIATVNAHQMTDLHMADLHNAGGVRINELCGNCHRTPQDAQLRSDPQSQTQRFMPYGLSLSRCFQKSNNKLTCITCHNPHTDASTDLKAYEAICLNCHSGSAATSSATQHINASSAPDKETVKANTVCPINPRSGCIACHMPTRRVFRTNPVPIAMADHWIRVNGKSTVHTH